MVINGILEGYDKSFCGTFCKTLLPRTSEGTKDSHIKCHISWSMSLQHLSHSILQSFLQKINFPSFLYTWASLIHSLDPHTEGKFFRLETTALKSIKLAVMGPDVVSSIGTLFTLM